MPPKISALIGIAAGALLAGAAVAAPPPVRFCIAAITSEGSIFFKNSSFCDAMMLPVIFNFPVVNSFIASALPVHISMKSASLISSVQSAVPTSPALTLPLPFFRSSVQLLSGPLSLKQ